MGREQISSFLRFRGGKELFISGESEHASALLFYILLANGADLNRGNELVKSAATCPQNAKEFIDRKGSSFTVTRFSRIPWLFGCDISMTGRRAKNIKKYPAFVSPRALRVITFHNTRRRFQYSLRMIDHRSLNSSLQNWHIMRNDFRFSDTRGVLEVPHILSRAI